MALESGSEPGAPHVAPLSPEATVQLLDRAKQGDAEALDRLLQRIMPALRRWSHGRLPQGARGLLQTDDLVQDTVIAAMRNLSNFEMRHQGALQAFLRTCVANRIRDIARALKPRPEAVPLPDHLVDRDVSPLEKAIGQENIARYEGALKRLSAGDQEAIIGRLELQYSYEELAVALNRDTPAAARMAVKRAMGRLAEEMSRG
jgi:RNA polymerase sigma factor (sigma-70 family)